MSDDSRSTRNSRSTAKYKRCSSNTECIRDRDINRHLKIAPFQMTRDSNDTAVRWAKWKKNIERQFRFFGIKDPQLKKDGLIIHGGQEIADLDDSIPCRPNS